MTRRRFAENFRTFGEWLKAQPRDTRYGKRIIRMHERFPNLILKELRDVRLKDQDLSTHSWNSLSSKEKSDRILSLQILREIRSGNHLSRVTKRLGVKKDSSVKHLGKYLYKSGRKWKVTASDRIEVEMLLYVRGEGQRTIITASSKDRSLIGQYFALLQKALRSNDPTVLDKFKDMIIVDAEGNIHHFETDLDRLYEIMEAQEEPEFLEIYQN